jgi:hypothetical protein
MALQRPAFFLDPGKTPHVFWRTYASATKEHVQIRFFSAGVIYPANTTKCEANMMEDNSTEFT